MSCVAFSPRWSADERTGLQDARRRRRPQRSRDRRVAGRGRRFRDRGSSRGRGADRQSRRRHSVTGRRSGRRARCASGRHRAHRRHTVPARRCRHGARPQRPPEVDACRHTGGRCRCAAAACARPAKGVAGDPQARTRTRCAVGRSHRQRAGWADHDRRYRGIGIGIDIGGDDRSGEWSDCARWCKGFRAERARPGRTAARHPPPDRARDDRVVAHGPARHRVARDRCGRTRSCPTLVARPPRTGRGQVDIPAVVHQGDRCRAEGASKLQRKPRFRQRADHISVAVQHRDRNVVRRRPRRAGHPRCRPEVARRSRARTRRADRSCAQPLADAGPDVGWNVHDLQLRQLRNVDGHADHPPAGGRDRRLRSGS